jgi:large subunit ribosomal protein L25
MSEALTLAAEARERAGKGASRALRREGRVPAVVYGGKEAPMGIHVEERDCGACSAPATSRTRS